MPQDADNMELYDVIKDPNETKNLVTKLFLWLDKDETIINLNVQDFDLDLFIIDTIDTQLHADLVILGIHCPVQFVICQASTTVAKWTRN